MWEGTGLRYLGGACWVSSGGLDYNRWDGLRASIVGEELGFNMWEGLGFNRWEMKILMHTSSFLVDLTIFILLEMSWWVG